MRLGVALAMSVQSLCPMAICLAQEDGPSYEEQRAAIEAQYRSFEFGRSFLKEAPEVQLAPLAFTSLPKSQKSQMYTRLAFTLQWEAHPQARGQWSDPGRMDIRVFAARNDTEHDLVEYKWVHIGQKLRALVSRNALRLDIDLDELDHNIELQEFGADQVQRARGLIEHTVRMRGESHAGREEFEVHIPWPDELTDGIRFSTDPDRSLMQINVYEWYKRVDFSVQNGTLSVLFYLTPGRVRGPLDGSKWFSDEFRAEVLARSRELGEGAGEPVQVPQE